MIPAQHFQMNNATVFLRPGQDEKQVRKRYAALFDRKPGSLYHDNNPKPPIDIEEETAKAELDWRQGVQIAYLFFKCCLECSEIAQALSVPVEWVIDFVEAELRAHHVERRLREKEHEKVESLSETLSRLTR